MKTIISFLIILNLLVPVYGFNKPEIKLPNQTGQQSLASGFFFHTAVHNIVFDGLNQTTSNVGVQFIEPANFQNGVNPNLLTDSCSLFIVKIGRDKLRPDNVTTKFMERLNHAGLMNQAPTNGKADKSIKYIDDGGTHRVSCISLARSSLGEDGITVTSTVVVQSLT